MDFLSTVEGSLLEGFFPKGWDMAKMDACCEKGVTREDFWHKDFNPVECENIYEFDWLSVIQFQNFNRSQINRNGCGQGEQNMKQRKSDVRTLTTAAQIAALNVILTLFAQMLGLASGVIQLRISEALTILPLFTWAAVPGLTIGCLLANVMTGCALWDVVVGTIATLLGALGTHYIGRKIPVLGPVFPIVANCIIVPPVLMYVYGAEEAYWFLVVTVGIGEILSCGVLGWMLYKALKRTPLF